MGVEDFVVSKVLLPLLFVLLGGLITYFFNTRNLEDKMRKVADASIVNHNQIKHQDTPWEVANEVLAKHEETCGKEVKYDIKDIKSDLKIMAAKQVEHNSTIESILRSISGIAKKLNVVE
jgi:glycosylphosphatidylinositol transamidase (GPIT) subunit GPI8